MAMIGGMYPPWLSQLLAVPWIEEACMILLTALVYFAVHSGVIPSKRKAKGKGKLVVEEEEDEAWNSEPRRPQRRLPGSEDKWGSTKLSLPKTSVEVAGVTDSRFEGTILSYKPEEGYGFIRCPELYKRFNRDVFLHKLQVGTFQIGAQVTFGIFLNKQGLPQAKELEEAVRKREAPRPVPTSEPCEVPLPAPAPSPERRQQLNPYAQCFVASGTTPLAPIQFEQGLSVPMLAMRGWAGIEKLAHTLSGSWAGDRGSTYEVHFYIKAGDDEPVGTVLRTRPGSAPKSFSLCWDAAHGHLQMGGSFVLDLQALVDYPDTAAWWRGQSSFIWQRVHPSSRHYTWEQEDSWAESCCNSQQWDAWAGHQKDWGPEDDWSQWTEGEKSQGAQKTPRTWAAQPQARAAKRWVRKDEPQ